MFWLKKLRSRKENESKDYYIVDPGKTARIKSDYEDNYFVGRYPHANRYVRSSELLTKQEVEKFQLSKDDVDRYLVPVRVLNRDVRFTKKGCGSRTTRDFDQFSPRVPKPLGGYKPGYFDHEVFDPVSACHRGELHEQLSKVHIKKPYWVHFGGRQ